MSRNTWTRLKKLAINMTSVTLVYVTHQDNNFTLIFLLMILLNLPENVSMKSKVKFISDIRAITRRLANLHFLVT